MFNKTNYQEDTWQVQQQQTIVAEIESILNNRPLTYVNSDVKDPQPLTQSHLFYGSKFPIPSWIKKKSMT